MAPVGCYGASATRYDLFSARGSRATDAASAMRVGAKYQSCEGGGGGTDDASFCGPRNLGRRLWIKSGILALATCPLSGSMLSAQLGPERAIGHLLGQRPAQAGSPEAFDRRAYRRRRHPKPTGDLTRVGTPPTNFNQTTSRTWRMLVLSAGIRSSSATARGAGPESASRGTRRPGDIIPEWWATSSRNGGRHHLGTVGGIISEPVGDIIPESGAASSGIST